jgi:hypothetical protein
MSDSEGPKVSIPDSFDDDIRGYRYFVTLDPSVPLKVLSKAGELRTPGQLCPSYGDESQGIWIPEAKSLAEILGTEPCPATSDAEEWRAERASSFVGDVVTGPMLDFLKCFRSVVEGNVAIEAKWAAVRKLCEDANASAELGGLFTDDQVEHLLSYCE